MHFHRMYSQQKKSKVGVFNGIIMDNLRGYDGLSIDLILSIINYLMDIYKFNGTLPGHFLKLSEFIEKNHVGAAGMGDMADLSISGYLERFQQLGRDW